MKAWSIMVLIFGIAYLSGYVIELLPPYIWFHSHLQLTAISLFSFLIVSLTTRAYTPILLAIMELAAFAVLLTAYTYYLDLSDVVFWYENLETFIESIALMQVIILISGFPNGFRRIIEYIRVVNILHFAANSRSNSNL